MYKQIMQAEYKQLKYNFSRQPNFKINKIKEENKIKLFIFQRII